MQGYDPNKVETPPELFWARIDGSGQQKLSANSPDRFFLNSDGTKIRFTTQNEIQEVVLPNGQPHKIYTATQGAHFETILPQPGTDEFNFALAHYDDEGNNASVKTIIGFFRFHYSRDPLQNKSPDLLVASAEVVFSPDGRQLAFFARDGLHLKSLGSNEEHIFRIFPDKTLVQWL